jgi:glycosyltransferase involved in cell wall biosynthesis
MGRGSGVPTIFKTLHEFGRDGEVHLILPSTKTVTDREGNVHIHTFRLFGWTRLGQFGPDRSVFSRSFPGGRIGRYLLDKLLWVQFVIQALWHGYLVNRQVSADVFYGVTPYGAPVAFLLRCLFGGINITRLLGTFLTPAVDFPRNWLGRAQCMAWLIPRFTEVLAFYWPSKALVITDDGTRGLEVARLLGRSEVHCWRNGIDVPTDGELSKSELLTTAADTMEHVSGIYIGQLVRWKRVDRLIEAVADLNCEAGDRFRLVIVGDGPERPALQELVRTRNIDSLVEFVGSVCQSELRHYHRRADFFVCTHDLTCACNATLEAMGAGLPVVATDVGATSEIIDSGSEGILVAPEDSVGLVQALRRLILDDSTRKQMGQRARARILRDFGTWRQRSRREFDLIRSHVDTSATQRAGVADRC